MEIKELHKGEDRMKERGEMKEGCEKVRQWGG